MNASRVVRMLQRAVLVLLVLAAGAYLALHSPLRAVIAQLVDLQSATCYFACSTPITVGQVTESASSLLLLAIAALAARASTQDLRGIPADRLLGFGLAWVAFVTVPAAFVAGAGQLIGASLLRPPLGPLLAAIPSAVVLVVRCVLGRRPENVGTCRRSTVGAARVACARRRGPPRAILDGPPYP